jgi:hypothetical protein
VDDWSINMVGKSFLFNVDQLAIPPPKLRPGEASAPSRFMKAKITGIPIGVGGSSVIFRFVSAPFSLEADKNHVAQKLFRVHSSLSFIVLTLPFS